jgi:putative Holliday junction resolvase
MHMNERIVCLDIGDVRIGVAVSDPTGTIAAPVEVINRIGWGPDTKRIKEICDRYQTNRILSGLPLNMDGTEGFQARRVRDFCAQLEKAGLQILFQDERLSTVSAEEVLIEGNVSRSGRKQVVDKIAATVILQQWLDSQKK